MAVVSTATAQRLALGVLTKASGTQPPLGGGGDGEGLGLRGWGKARRGER